MLGVWGEVQRHKGKEKEAQKDPQNEVEILRGLTCWDSLMTGHFLYQSI